MDFLNKICFQKIAQLLNIIRSGSHDLSFPELIHFDYLEMKFAFAGICKEGF